MMRVKENIWNEYLDIIESDYQDRFPYPLRDYFYVIGNIIIFDLKKELDRDIKDILSILFDTIFDD